MTDPVWEQDIYSQGFQLNRYPFDLVVSFVFRNAPRDRPRAEVSILEIGSGAGNNLWFAAREGFSVAGIDGSPSATDYAKARFAAEGLRGDLRTGDFTALPWPDRSFDLVIDRGSLTCVGRTAARLTVAEIHRVLRPGGRVLFNPYSDRHTSQATGTPGPDGLTVDIRGGTLTGVGGIRFYGAAEVNELFSSGWNERSRELLVITEQAGKAPTTHAEWRVIAEKAGETNA